MQHMRRNIISIARGKDLLLVAYLYLELPAFNMRDL